MDKIKALIDYPPITSGRRGDLHIVVNNERLDLFLGAESGRDFRGLSPAWQVFAGSGPELGGLRAFIAEQSRLDRGEQLLPILLEPNDSGSIDPAVVVEVRPAGEEVHWLRFGLDSAASASGEAEKIEWLDGPGPLHFDRRQYLDCLETFKHCQPLAVSPYLKPDLKRSFLRQLCSILGAFALVGVAGGASLPALAYNQVQNGLTETPDPPKWSFERLLPVSGFWALGLDQSERYLMAISQNGRDLFNLNDGRREARAGGSQIIGEGETAAAEGLGALAGHLIPLWGPLGRLTPLVLMREGKLVSNGLSAIEAVLSADEDRLLIVGQEDGIYIFNRLPDYPDP